MADGAGDRADEDPPLDSRLPTGPLPYTDPIAEAPHEVSSEGARRFAEAGGWPGVLVRMFARTDLSWEEASDVLGEILQGRASAVQLAAFLSALRTKGETAEEIAGFVAAMLANGVQVELHSPADEAVDIVGTGGDRSGTINASTLAALVVAAAGAVVCKHGNRSSSSLAGSADVLEALGVAISLGPGGVAGCVEETGFGFCLAPRFHPAMGHAAPVRRELGVGTVFNLLGPLANPARVGRQVVGVSTPALAATMLDALERAGSVHSMIVYGHDGLDELSTVATSHVLESRCQPDGSRARREYEIVPSDLGLRPASGRDLVGGDVRHNAERARAILGAEPGPQREFVLLNAAAGLVVAGLVDDLSAGLSLGEQV
ncbi:MAG: anthranilate phosphoribosyltransferase, partial [Acidimicrobiales bacterium]